MPLLVDLLEYLMVSGKDEAMALERSLGRAIAASYLT